MQIQYATPDRNTRIEFGSFPGRLLQPHFLYDRKADEINAAEESQVSGLIYEEGIGIQLRAHQASPEYLNEVSPGAVPTPIVRPAHTVAPKHLLAYYAKPTNLTGVTYNGGEDARHELYQKKVESGGSWDAALSADQASFPGPTDPNVFTQWNRVYVASDVHDPSQAVMFTFVAPSSKINAPGNAIRCYFCGPAGSAEGWSGTGRYCVVVSYSGSCTLYEQSTAGAWAEQSKFSFKTEPGVFLNHLIVRTNATQACGGNWQGNRITFSFQAKIDDKEYSSGLLAQFTAKTINLISPALSKASAFVYAVPRKTQLPIQQVPCRIDTRVDVRQAFNLGFTTYPASGFVEDEPIGFPGVATDAKPFILEWYGQRPTGTTLTIKLFDAATGTELVGTTLIDDCLGQQISYAIPSGAIITKLRVRFDMTGPGTSTPTLARYKLIRGPVIAEALAPSLTVPIRAEAPALPSVMVKDVSINGPSESSESESSSFEVVDMFGEAEEIGTKSGTPFDIAVEDDAGDLVTYLTRGVIKGNESSRVSRKAGLELSTRYRITGDGEWGRLRRAIAPARIVLSDTSYIGPEFDGPPPMKATDALKILFTAGGYSPDQIDVPDLPIRLWGGEDQLVIEPSSPIFDSIASIVSDYLGGYILFDRNAGDYGMWRVLTRKHVGDYKFLARFTPAHPGDKKLAHLPGSYGMHDYGDYEAPILPMMGVTNSLEPAEANLITVNGLSYDPSQGSRSPSINSAFAINFQSVNAMNLPDGHEHLPDPSSINYLGDLVRVDVYDSTLNSKAATDWLVRRVYDATAYGRRYKRFTSWVPLITDDSDPLQARPRPLRFYDMVEVYDTASESWNTWVITACNIRYQHSKFMLAEYEIMTSDAIDQFALARPRLSRMTLAKKGRQMDKAVNLGIPRGSVLPFSMNRILAAGPALRAWTVLPDTVDAETVQYLDPAESNFGQFKPMAGYDPSA